jgi:hypothetical protein
MKLLNTLADTAAQRGCGDPEDFVRNTLRELSVGLCAMVAAPV